MSASLLNTPIAPTRVVPEKISGNIYRRENWLPNVGDVCASPPHNFSHDTMCLNGGIRVTAISPEGVVQTLDIYARNNRPGGRYSFLTRAGYRHEIVALEPASFFICVYSHRKPQARLVQADTGWETEEQPVVAGDSVPANDAVGQDYTGWRKAYC